MKIQDFLKQMRTYWKYAATDKDGKIYFYSAKPRICDNFWNYADKKDSSIRIVDVLDDLFDIELFECDWKDSLICREEC